MTDPHRVEDHATEQAPLHRDVQGLVVRVADHLGGKPGLADRIALEQVLGRPGAVPEQRRLRDELQRFSPEFEPFAVERMTVAFGW